MGSMARELLTVCPRCGKENPAEAQFCMHCGTALYRTCSTCGTSNPPDAQFCLQCGTPLSEATQVERRVLSVLFADLVASTPLTAGLDPERTRTIVGGYFAAMRQEVERHGGVVEKFIGDAVMSVFGLPQAHEDDPERAVRAAMAMQARMPALNTRLAADLHIRIGISTGEVVADPRRVAAGEFMVTGEVVNLAARLQTQAPPDGIVVDERTFVATRPAVQYEPLPAAQGGDFADRARWRLTGLAEGPAGTRLRAPLVGREDESSSCWHCTAGSSMVAHPTWSRSLAPPGSASRGWSRNSLRSCGDRRYRRGCSAAGARPTGRVSRTGRWRRCCAPSVGSKTTTPPPSCSRSCRPTSSPRAHRRSAPRKAR